MHIVCFRSQIDAAGCYDGGDERQLQKVVA